MLNVPGTDVLRRGLLRLLLVDHQIVKAKDVLLVANGAAVVDTTSSIMTDSSLESGESSNGSLAQAHQPETDRVLLGLGFLPHDTKHFLRVRTRWRASGRRYFLRELDHLAGSSD